VTFLPLFELMPLYERDATLSARRQRAARQQRRYSNARLTLQVRTACCKERYDTKMVFPERNNIIDIRADHAKH